MRVSLLLVSAVSAIVASTHLVAYEQQDRDVEFRVRFELDHSSDELEKKELLLKEGDFTNVPIVQTLCGRRKREPFRSTGIQSLVPSPELMQDFQLPPGGPEMFDVGPRLTCRVRSAPDDQILLDVMLAETRVNACKALEGTLSASTRELRSVQPVRIGQLVTLSWPADEGGEVNRRVTITVAGQE